MSQRQRTIRCIAAMALLPGLLTVTSAAGAQSRPADVPRHAIAQQTARCFVVVNYHLQKSDRPSTGPGISYYHDSKSTLERILNRQTLSAPGVMISAKGEVLTTEKELYNPDTIGRITVTGPDGTTLPAQPDRLLARAPGRILRVEGPIPKAWQVLAFAEIDDVTPDDNLYSVTFAQGEQSHLQVQSCSHDLNWSTSEGSRGVLRIQERKGLAVICNATGQAVGATVARRIQLGPEGIAWRGKTLQMDPGIPWDRQQQFEAMLREKFTRTLYEVRFDFRLPPAGQGRNRFDEMTGFADPSGRNGRSESVSFGLGVAPDKILILNKLPDKSIESLDTITIQVDGEPRPARFGGVLKPFESMVIELVEGKLPHVWTPMSDGPLARTEPFWAIYAREMAGIDLVIENSRWIDKVQGHADQWYPTAERPIHFGSWLVDHQGELVGVFTRPRHAHERLEKYLLGETYPGYGMSRSSRINRGTGDGRIYGLGDARFFSGPELVRLFENLPDHYDEHIRHLSKEAQQRRAWLGVEYTALNKDMIKQLDLREPTRDGQIGLMVNHVYANAPASALGLAKGDILLQVMIPDTPWPIDLHIEQREQYDFPDFDDMDIPEEFRAMGLSMPRRCPWPPRGNYLTQLLSDIGIGRKVRLRYIHENVRQEREFVIEQAPRDMASAAKYKNEQLGLSVKDITYEVRNALRLQPDDNGIVVVEIEQGRAAALARLNPYELIRAVDGESVEDVSAFETCIAKAQQDKKESVRLTVEWMGKTRLADLNFAATRRPGLLESLLPGLQGREHQP